MTQEQQEKIDQIVYDLGRLAEAVRNEWPANLDTEQNSVWFKRVKDIESAARTLRELE